MKTMLISCFLVALSWGFACAQTGQTDKLQVDESARVEVERSIISKELIQLRDSINQSIKVIDTKIKKAKANARPTLENAQNELIEYRNRVKFDLQETSLTAENAWTAQSVTRIRANTEATRREYNRIRKMISA